MSDTPETDAAWAAESGNRLSEIKKISRKLERERDEAIKKIQRQAERIRKLEGATNHATGTPLSIALRERDEAREELNRYKRQWEESRSENVEGAK
jgi:hypothetical protein